MSGFRDDEDDIQAALAASMKDVQNPPSRPERDNYTFVDLTADSDDDTPPLPQPSVPETEQNTTREIEYDSDLERALQLSLQQPESLLSPSPPAPKEAESLNEIEEVQPNKEAESVEPPPTVYGILGIDRKKQEEERLARLAKKRKAGEGPSLSASAERESKISKVDNDNTKGKSTAPAPKPPQQNIINLTQPKSETPLEFPNGVVKKTWASRCNRESDIKIEEVLQSSDIELAILSSFKWDMDWLFSKFENQSTRFYLIMGAKGEDMKQQILQETISMPRLRVCFPSMEGEINCMHSKLMLLFHQAYLRIVVPSANLVPYDWGEFGGFMENVVFLIDLPRKPCDAPEDSDVTHFRKELIRFLKASNVDQSLIDKTLQFDFSRTKDYAFVHSIGGSHAGAAHRRTGFCGLGRAVSSLGLSVSRPVKLDYVTSSVGSLNSQFLRCIYRAAQGDDGSKELSLRSTSSKASKAALADEADEEWKDRLVVYFPSLRTVRDSRGGKSGAGTICFQSKWYNSASFPQHILRDVRSVREGLLMHNKMLFVRPEADGAEPPDSSISRNWAYVGSANLSESAWGRLVIDRKTKEPKLNCRNWECGVIVQTPENNKAGKTSTNRETARDDNDFSKVFGPTVPVPMHLPGDKYRVGDKPWFYLEDA